MNFPYLR